MHDAIAIEIISLRDDQACSKIADQVSTRPVTPSSSRQVRKDADSVRVLHFCPLFDPSGIGGTETFITKLAKLQSQRGDVVELICPNRSVTSGVSFVDGLKCTHFPFPYGSQDKAFLNGTSQHHTCQVFRRVIIDFSPDVIHLHGLYPHFLPYFESILPSLSGKLVVTIHLANVLCARQGLVDFTGAFCDGITSQGRCSACMLRRDTDDGLVRKFLSTAARMNCTQKMLIRILPPASRVDAQLRVLGFLRNNCHVDVLNDWMMRVFSLNNFEPRRLSKYAVAAALTDTFGDARLVRSSERVKLAFVGRVTRAKGVSVLLESIRRLADLRDKFSLQLIGPLLESDLISEVTGLKDGGFHIDCMGAVEHERVLSILEKADYLVFPSSRDMSPLVIQEALSVGTPIIACRVPSTQDLVKESLNGFLFSADDPESLSGVVRNVVESGIRIYFSFNPRVPEDERRFAYYQRIYLGMSGRDFQ